jgi:putative addiction module antidote
MDIKLRKIGNSLGVILPKKVIENLHLKNGDELKLTSDDKQLILEPINKEFAEWAEAYRSANATYKDVLNELAK